MIDYKDKKTIYSIIIIGLVLLFSVPVFIRIRMIAAQNTNRQLQSEMLVDISEDWKDERGNPVDLSRLYKLEDVNNDEKVSIYYDLPDILANEQRINFLSSNIFFRAHINGVNVYGNHTPVVTLLGKSYGVAYNSILIQKRYQGARVYIDIEKIYDDSGSISNMYYGGNAAYIYYFLNKYMFSFILSILIIVVGVLFLIFSKAISQEKMLQLSLRAFAVVSVLFGIWATGRTCVPILLQNDPNIWKLFDYPILILCPFPSVLFVNGLLDKPNKRYISSIFYITLTEILALAFMRLVFDYDFHKCRYIIHVVMLYAIGQIIYMFIKDGITKDKIMLISGFVIVLLCVLGDFVRYYLFKSPSADHAMFTRIGYFILEMILFYKYIVMIIQSMRTFGETEMYKKMAYIDALTGIGNRAAFLEEEKKLQKRLDAEDDLKIAAFSIDINYLKQVNDTYGHVTGDNYIKTCAEIVNITFSSYGSVFRVGGDEFSVFIPGVSLQSIVDECIREFEEAIKAENDKKRLPVDVSIAYGYYICDNTEDNAIENAEVIADKHMYDMKKDMKLAF